MNRGKLFTTQLNESMKRTNPNSTSFSENVHKTKIHNDNIEMKENKKSYLNTTTHVFHTWKIYLFIYIIILSNF